MYDEQTILDASFIAPIMRNKARFSQGLRSFRKPKKKT